MTRAPPVSDAARVVRLRRTAFQAILRPVVATSSARSSGGTANGVPRLFSVRVLKWVVLALAVRYAVMWFSHPWDITTFHNLFVNLSQGVDPYAEVERLSRLASSSIAHWNPFYEYYAYPPGLLLAYKLPAELWALLVGGQQPHWLLPGLQFVIPPREVLDPVFQFIFKTPIFLADIGVGYLLMRFAGMGFGLAYLFNPLVIVVSASWSFDALPVLCVVAAYFLVRSRRPGLAGISLAVGTLLKIFPVVLVPVMILRYLKRQDYWSLGRFSLGFFPLLVLVVTPFWDGLVEALAFHGARTGGGLSIHQILYLVDTVWTAPLLWVQGGLSPAVGSVTLILALGLAYLWVWRADPPLLNAWLVTIMAFLLGSKLVNEQFVVWLIPLLLLGIAYQDSRNRRFLYWSFTLLPLIFAAVNVPLTGFLFPLGHLGVISFETLSLPSEWMFGTLPHAIIKTGLALAFVVITALGIRTYASSEPELRA